MAQNRDFFKRQKDHSRIKTEIVTEYLPAWATIIWPSIQSHRGDRLKYIDLFSGPGRYQDGTPSTPLRVMDAVMENDWMLNVLETHFFEADVRYVSGLMSELTSHSAHDRLKFAPRVFPGVITHTDLSEIKKVVSAGSFTFIDPFGYKEISLDLIDLATRDWGCDCLFYLTAVGVERNVTDPTKREQFVRLVGTTGYEALQKAAQLHSSKNLLEVLIDELHSALRSRHRVYVLPFCIEFDDRRRPSHSLVFVSKSPTGFKVMRDIMIKHSQKDQDDFPLYLHSQVLAQQYSPPQLGLQNTTILLHEYAKQLLGAYLRQTLTVDEIVRHEETSGSRYRSVHVQKALKFLLDTKKIHPIGVLSKPRSRSILNLTDSLTFPKQLLW